MKIGTKSVLFGAHQFALHPLFVALGWFKLHGFRRVQIGTTLVTVDGWQTHRAEHASLWRPALWVAFLVHDIGYVGKPNMDGPEGEQHPRAGAAIMRVLFGEPWGSFVLYHSRFLAKQEQQRPSALCVADKYGSVLTPRWIYLPCVRLTGEIREYMAKSAHMNETGGKYADVGFNLDDEKQWHADWCAYMRRWIDEHKDGRDDSWTPDVRAARTESGVWS